MKLLFLLLITLLSFSANAQTYKLYQTQNIHNQLKLNTRTGQIYQIQDDGQSFLVCSALTPNGNKSRYCLYQTKNIWTYILLDQITGKLWQCQYSVEGDEYRGIWVINSTVLSNTDSNKFTIEPLTSMFQYYLVNQDTGELWKFQWSTKGDDYRWIEKR